MEDKILQLLQENFTMLNEKLDRLDEKVNRLDEKVEDNTKAITELKAKLDVIDGKLDDIEIRNAESHLEYINSLNSINESIDFLKHENMESRQDLFIVKKRIQDKVRG